LEIGYLDFDEMVRRVSKKKDDLDKVCREIKSELDPILESKIEKILREPDYNRRLEKLAKQKADLVRRAQGRSKKWQEVVIEAIVKARQAGKISGKRFDEIFGHTSSEKKLSPIVYRYFKNEVDKKYRAYYDTVIIGRSRTDLVLYKECVEKRKVGERGHLWKKKPVYEHRKVKEVVAIEAKVDYNEFRRLKDQVNDYQMAADKVYLACTTPLVLEKGQKELIQDLKHSGVGLIHVDMWKRKCKIRLESRKGRAFDNKQKKDLIDRYFA